MSITTWTNKWEKILRRLYEQTKSSQILIYGKLVDQGFEGSYGAVDRKIRRLIEEGKMEKRFPGQIWEGMRVGYLDIETTGLYADIHYMLTWSIKERGTNKVLHDTIYRKDIQSMVLDAHLVKSLLKAMDEFDVILGYNSTNFDIPFIRARCIKHNIDFFPYESKFHQDIYYMAKRLLRITRKSLKVVCEHMGIVGKTPLPRDVWQKASLGDEKSLRYVLDHNIADVRITEKVHRRLERYVKPVRRSI